MPDDLESRRPLHQNALDAYLRGDLKPPGRAATIRSLGVYEQDLSKAERLMPDDLESMLAEADETEIIIIRRLPDGTVDVDTYCDEDELVDILLSVVEVIHPSIENICEECE